MLVDVHDLLDFKKDAYELLCQIGNRSGKKTFKRPGVLKDYAENWGNHYAIPKPKTPEEKQREKERRARLGLPADDQTMIAALGGLRKELEFQWKLFANREEERR